MLTTGCRNKLSIVKDLHSGLRVVEHIKLEMLKNGLVPIVILINEEMHIDVFYENVSGTRPATRRMLANIQSRFCDPSIHMHKYDSYESVISTMEKNKTEVFWESMNNWRLKS